MNFLRKIIKWIQWGVAGLCLALSFSTLTSSISVTLCLIGLGVICSPIGGIPYSKLTSKKSKQYLFRLLSFVIVFSCMFVFISDVATIEEYENNRAQILTDLTEKMNLKKFDEVLKLSEPYYAAGIREGDFIEIYEKAKTESQIQNILLDLKKVPVEQYEKNKDLYAKLVELDPENQIFKNKLDFYTKKSKSALQTKRNPGYTLQGTTIEVDLVIDPSDSIYWVTSDLLSKVYSLAKKEPSSTKLVVNLYMDGKRVFDQYGNPEGKNVYMGKFDFEAGDLSEIRKYKSASWYADKSRIATYAVLIQDLNLGYLID